ncbi:MAG: hypothetical protein M3024_04595 [Candidatus Dormibacteraeota bacterium]|nr:hypothetical protein [Candidatus Dormibacteraeota bacterium]
MVTPRILVRRRLAPGRAPEPHSTRRRRSAVRPLVDLSGSAAVQRLRLSSYARAYAVAAVVLTFALAYLIVAAGSTQSAYELSLLQAQRAQLQADQDQLRYQALSQHAPARIAEEASAQGLSRPAGVKPIPAQPVTIDLKQPIGPGLPSTGPAWQRLLDIALGARANRPDAG